MLILVIIGYTLLRLFGGDVAHWLYWFNSETLQFNWIGMLAKDLKGEGLISTIVWMAPFVWLGVVGSAKTKFTGTSHSE